MIDRILLHLAVFGFSVVAICYGKELNSNEAEARIFLKQTSDKLLSFYDEITAKAFDKNIDSYDEHEANKNYSIFLKQIFDDSRKFDIKNFKDDELKYAFKMLDKEVDEYVIGEERYSELFVSLQELENLYKENIIEDYHNSNIKLAYNPDIAKIIETSNDSAELQYYWSAWRNTTGQWAETNLNITIEALRDAARLSESSPLDFWSRGINITEMENSLAQIQPLYLELHAFIRNLLGKKYGESIVSSGGLIPEYLFEQVLHQAWSNESSKSIIDEMFPYKNLPPFMMEKFKAKQLYEIADKFYENLGFEKYPSSVWGDRIRMQETEGDTEDCTTRVWYGTPNIYLEFCKNLDIWGFFEAYENMGYIYYAKEMADLPSYFSKSVNGLQYAIGNAVLLSASTHHNLKTIGMIPDFDITQEVELNRLLRMAISNILYIPINFINAKVMADLLSGNIKTTELNSHYWQLMAKYAGVGQPKDYKSHTFDISDNFFLEMNDNQMSSDFTADIWSYQIYKKLCELSDKYPKEPLHLCDLNRSKQAGNSLKKMMKLGSSKPFNEVIATMFPENPTMSADSLLEYYNPIKKLLVEKNKEANVKPGWKTTDSNTI